MRGYSWIFEADEAQSMAGTDAWHLQQLCARIYTVTQAGPHYSNVYMACSRYGFVDLSLSFGIGLTIRCSLMIRLPATRTSLSTKKGKKYRRPRAIPRFPSS
jgi:hypothetical protein